MKHKPRRSYVVPPIGGLPGFSIAVDTVAKLLIGVFLLALFSAAVVGVVEIVNRYDPNNSAPPTSPSTSGPVEPPSDPPTTQAPGPDDTWVYNSPYWLFPAVLVTASIIALLALLSRRYSTTPTGWKKIGGALLAFGVELVVLLGVSIGVGFKSDGPRTFADMIQDVASFLAIVTGAILVIQVIFTHRSPWSKSTVAAEEDEEREEPGAESNATIVAADDGVLGSLTGFAEGVFGSFRQLIAGDGGPSELSSPTTVPDPDLNGGPAGGANEESGTASAPT